MPRIIERVFDPMKPTIVRRFFAGAGRHWNPGDVFPWRRLAVDQRRARLLFEAGKLMHPAEGSEMLSAEPADMSPVPSIAQDMQDEDIHHLAVTAEPDGLEDLGMKELRAIAEAEGAPTRVSRTEQRKAIRENRNGQK